MGRLGARRESSGMCAILNQTRCKRQPTVGHLTHTPSNNETNVERSVQPTVVPPPRTPNSGVTSTF
eukprot:5201427-Pyramimonas_sp.AAC.2